MFHLRHPKAVLFFFIIASIASLFIASQRLYFRFSFEDFFPKGDPDLEFYFKFKKNFEPDDNFLLVAIKRENGIFDASFLKKVRSFSLEARDIQFTIQDSSGSPWELNKNIEVLKDGKNKFRVFPILESNSITQIEYPIITPFSVSSIPAIHLDDPELLLSDKEKITKDERLINQFVSKDGKTTVVIFKNIDNIQQEVAEKLIYNLHLIAKKYKFEGYHILGRANFQTELVAMQTRELILSTLVSGSLVLLIFSFIFKRFWGVIISSFSILVGLFIFCGIIGIIGKPLDSLALLYPIIMIIVGTSDVVHLMIKYTDELEKNKSQKEAIVTTLKEIGLSVFLTSFTTAVGFFSWIFSKLEPIRNFGINAAIGVLVAYLTVIFFTTSFLMLFDKNQIYRQRESKSSSFWYLLFTKINRITIVKRKWIGGISILLIIVCLWGISQINTNSKIEKMLPIGASVTDDFFFFEKNFSGFRPFEIAIIPQNGKNFDDYEVVLEIDKIEKKLRTYAAIKSTTSLTLFYKSMNRASHGDNSDYYRMPDSTNFKKYQKLLKKLKQKSGIHLLVSKDKKFARISSRLLDIGGDQIKELNKDLENFIAKNINADLIQCKQTGTGLIVDKNLEYIRDSLLQGLLFAILIISLTMVILYRNLKMVIVALIPNLIPMLIAGAILGFSGIPLEAGVAIVFTIIFGIAVDDTIHILGRYRILKSSGLQSEEAISLTLTETGKAVTLTTVILFFGFAILLFSVNPPAVTIGILISTTLLSALICDVFLIPVLLRSLSL